MTCSEDKLLTLSNHQGDTVQDTYIVKQEPTMLTWCPSADPNKKVIACILAQKQLFVYDTSSQKNFTINFNPQYGKVACYQWYGEDSIIIGFMNGVVGYYSLKEGALGTELKCINIGVSAAIDTIQICHDLQKLAVAQLGVIKFYSLEDWSEYVGERLEITKSAGKITQMSWSKDGSIMTLATGSGYFFGFLTIVPSICSACDNYACLLSGLTEISVVDCAKNNMIVAKGNLEVEPSFVNIGPIHFAVGINNQIWYYRWRQPGYDNKMNAVQLVCKREYFGTIKQVVLNERWTAVLSEGKVSLHMIEDQSGNDRRFPQTEQDKPIVYIALVS